MAEKSTIHGTTDRQEVASEFLYRDTTPGFVRFFRWLRTPSNMVMFLMSHIGIGMVYPVVFDLLLISGLFFALWGLSLHETCPLKMPMQSGEIDPNEINPGTGKASKAAGIFFMGNEKSTNKEIWLTNSDCRQHFLVLGTTGAGKALPDSERVLTPSGYVPIANLKVHDKVIGSDGKAAIVTGFHPQEGKREVYLLTFEDGRSMRACEEHLWTASVDGGVYQLMTTLDVHNAQALGRKVYIPLLSGPAQTGVGGTEEPDLYMLGSSAGRLRGRDLAIDASRMSAAARMGFARGVMDNHVKAVDGRSFLIGDFEPAVAGAIADVLRSLGCVARTIARGPRSEIAVRASDPRSLFEINPPATLPEAETQIRLAAVSAVGEESCTCITIDNEDHLFVAGDYVLTHNTEALIGFAANALTWASGFLFVDGKGDVSLFAKLYALARRFAREDDILLINYMTGNQDLGAAGGIKLSNTVNPFSTGSSDALTQMVVSLMDDAGGDGAMWKGRATAMFTGVMRALVWMRDEGLVDLNISDIRDHLNLRKIIDLGDQSKFPNMPQAIQKSITSYLTSLPGFNPEKGYNQAQTSLDQHGYLEMQFTKILGSMADVYGHIFFTSYGEVDMNDVVLNRRMLVVMLPALEKAPDEIANLGKIIVAMLKGMMGQTLGNRVQGSYTDVVEKRVTSSPSPFVVILDEVGYYSVEGLALLAAQARSLGFMMTYASQDIPAMQKLNEKEAKSIIANTNTKVFMRIEEMNETAKLAVDSAGEAIRSQTRGYQGKPSEIGSIRYTDGFDAGFEKTGRINTRDLKGQSEGEMHITHKDKVIRAQAFYADPTSELNKKKLNIEPTHFIEVAKPSPDDLHSASQLPLIYDRIMDASRIEAARRKADAAVAAIKERVLQNDEIAITADTFAQMSAKRRPDVEAACAAIARIGSEIEATKDEFVEKVSRSATAMDILEEIHQADTAPARRPAAADFGMEGLFDIDAPEKDEARRSGRGGLREVDHIVSMRGDENRTVDMAKDILFNETIMTAIAALDFDEQTATRDEIGEKLGKAAMLSDIPPEMDRKPTSAEMEAAIAASDDTYGAEVDELPAPTKRKEPPPPTQPSAAPRDRVPERQVSDNASFDFLMELVDSDGDGK